MKLVQTRAKKDENLKKVELTQALLSPSSKYGGLYAPKKFPCISQELWSELADLKYEKFALEILKLFKFDIKKDILKKALKRYRSFDDPKNPVELKKIDKNIYVNELYHGPTRAFKDMALAPFGEVLSSLAKQKDEKYLIMCATSGDTGPATLNTFANTENIKVVCIYPADGTSEVQRLQMVCMKGENLKVIGIKGDFDDAQNTLKTLLADDGFKAELKRESLNLSAANSVNFGRIMFQIIYHAYTYAKLLKDKVIDENQSIDIIVPSGNFGNALGAYYAKKMGAKIGKIKIASNKNKILTEFFNTGKYDLRDKKLAKTISPAMDILISSNIERLLFDKFGAVRTRELMKDLSKNKFYKLKKSELAKLQEDFVADFCTDKECEKFIKKWVKKGYAIDPHTATCFKMIDDKSINIVTSTAHWVKFAPSMLKACDMQSKDEKQGLKKLAKKLDQEIPKSIKKLFNAKNLHPDIVEKDSVKDEILSWIKQ
ncbi:threonine synthase [Campylobacter pinnipediorum subsp. caledonicus]|uniref:Threonine synthase n=1 Tax=Campylobacter pinnipediorum subsp. caledonicus TaxID=1874362 RepID=A0A1S6U708_9BACT|nr:threonine synthase [Campylobacter pinnipediorum]AQW85860.1 threonine synthase [Campylobacter pinnipediorum subsp. caledonicus]AQW87469.1 threonine synthase [Campylobacter pinnipediorum subsp. caledonicus]